MDPISICRFDCITSTQPAVCKLTSLAQLVEFFTSKEPPTVKKEQRNQLFSMVAYKPGTRRSKENVETLSAIVLDFDNTEDGQLKLPEFIEQLKQLGLIYLYYTTWSHTQVRHRWRLILPFEKAIAANFWREAHARVLKLLGNPVGLDKAASKDMARMWIMPCKAEGGAYEVGYDIAGKFLAPHTLPQTAKTILPLVIQSEFHESTPSDICDALNCIDVNCEYDLWLRMGMALHHELGNRGFAIWNTWSSRGKKYKDAADLRCRWLGFKSGHGVTIATLFKHARDAGWQPTPPANPIAYVITTPTSDSATEKPLKVDNQIAMEEFEEADEFVDPIEKCLADLEPFAVVDIFDFPCAILKSTYDWIQSVAPVPIPIFSLSACLSLMAFLKRDGIIGETNLKNPNSGLEVSICES